MPRPSLLVSVRNVAEAQAAIDGGCDRLDVKEPLRGPLGMADAGVIAEIAAFAAQSARAASPIRCSVALGEIHESEHNDRSSAWPSSPVPRSVLPAGVNDIKLGPARLDTRQRWTEGWRHALGRFGGDESRAIRRVAVAYADWSSAGAFPPDEILAASLDVGADAFLIDTWQKDAGTLLDVMSLQDLGRLSNTARRAAMPLALAGSLRLEHLPLLIDFHPDVIAVRGARAKGKAAPPRFRPLACGGSKRRFANYFEPGGKRLSMRDHESAMLSYIRLAAVSQRMHQALGRDKLLVLAAAAACRAGWLEVAERCRQLVLEHNPAHLIGDFPSVPDALRSEDFAPLIKQHERLCGYERAEFLVHDLRLEPAHPDGHKSEEDKTAGQIALDLLSPPRPQP